MSFPKASLRCLGSRLGDYPRGEIGGNDEERRATVGLEMEMQK